MKKNDWQKVHGARRREIDKALLAECERQIAAEDKAFEEEHERLEREIKETRARIARALGRPL